MSTVTINPIKSEKDYQEALDKIYNLMNTVEPNTPEGDELDILVTLVEAFENKYYPINSPTDPIEAIKYWMEQKNLKQIDLIPYIGQKGHVSEILSGKRQLTVKMIKALHRGLGIPLESLIG
ncbi:MAG: helix-turn-helix domain-containing protein [Spirochaetota bacterium]|nr:helix-turn-helix domain-containing protein [Spirochaetota bacterium]